MTLAERIAAAPYEAYLYAYPHKTAYRAITPGVPLREAWAAERRDALFLYLHVPFCEMRCGFCNLFTTARPREEMVRDYLATLARQARVVRAELGGDARFARFAIGGGTPTLLDAADLAQLLDLAERFAGAPLASIPGSVETSPETLDAEKARLLRARGVERVSIGVQSFDDAEVAAVFRPQTRATVDHALALLAEQDFPTLNVDLIYGLPGQDETSLARSIDAALAFGPEEIYLYPLYVRPVTTLAKSSRSWNDERRALYRAGRDHLLARGFVQRSMRMFRRADAPDVAGPVYCCQTDGMVGLGCGARSYTESLHGSTEYAVGGSGVKRILEEWIARDDASFARVDWGFALDEDERRRRYLILSLLADGLDLDAYRRRFGGEALAHFPQLGELETLRLARAGAGRLALTAEGVELSDAIGPWLFSPEVARRMAAWEAH